MPIFIATHPELTLFENFDFVVRNAMHMYEKVKHTP